MTASQNPLRAAIVGCHGIGKTHAKGIEQADLVELVALCDLDEQIARELAHEYGNPPVYTDISEMITEIAPDIACLAVPTSAHAPLAVQATRAGVKGILCEKPMAKNMAEAHGMIETCRENGTHLIANHQRRTVPTLIKMRELIADGAIGEAYLVRASCPGDIITDGTHAIDSVRFLAGDADVDWVFGNVYRVPVDPDKPIGKGCIDVDGWRYRHGCPIENGGFGLWRFADGTRAELLCGDLRVPGRGYQDYEVFGSEGRLWRPGDGGTPNLLIQTSETGGWQAVDGCVPEDSAITFARNYDRLAENIHSENYDHPLMGENGLRVLEIIMSIYESARIRARITLPLQQDRLPTEIMVEDGTF
ncbi:Gfo/Idh/MocA family protein [Candidatus Poribacteria bacterium]